MNQDIGLVMVYHILLEIFVQLVQFHFQLTQHLVEVELIIIKEIVDVKLEQFVKVAKIIVEQEIHIQEGVHGTGLQKIDLFLL